MCDSLPSLNEAFPLDFVYFLPDELPAKDRSPVLPFVESSLLSTVGLSRTFSVRDSDNSHFIAKIYDLHDRNSALNLHQVLLGSFLASEFGTYNSSISTVYACTYSNGRLISVSQPHGSTLAAYVTQRVLSMDEVRSIMHQIVPIVAHLHAHGIAVRNLTLSSFAFALGDPSVIQLIDLSAAAIAARDSEGFPLGMSMPTLPLGVELPLGVAPPSPPTWQADDAYAVGAILHHLIHRRPPPHRDPTGLPTALASATDAAATTTKSRPARTPPSPPPPPLLAALLHASPACRPPITAFAHDEWFTTALPPRAAGALARAQRAEPNAAAARLLAAAAAALAPRARAVAAQVAADAAGAGVPSAVVAAAAAARASAVAAACTVGCAGGCAAQRASHGASRSIVPCGSPQSLRAAAPATPSAAAAAAAARQRRPSARATTPQARAAVDWDSDEDAFRPDADDDADGGDYDGAHGCDGDHTGGDACACAHCWPNGSGSGLYRGSGAAARRRSVAARPVHDPHDDGLDPSPPRLAFLTEPPAASGWRGRSRSVCSTRPRFALDCDDDDGGWRGSRSDGSRSPGSPGSRDSDHGRTPARAPRGGAVSHCGTQSRSLPLPRPAPRAAPCATVATAVELLTAAVAAYIGYSACGTTSGATTAAAAAAASAHRAATCTCDPSMGASARCAPDALLRARLLAHSGSGYPACAAHTATAARDDGAVLHSADSVLHFVRPHLRGLAPRGTDDGAEDDPALPMPHGSPASAAGGTRPAASPPAYRTAGSGWAGSVWAGSVWAGSAGSNALGSIHAGARARQRHRSGSGVLGAPDASCAARGPAPHDDDRSAAAAAGAHSVAPALASAVAMAAQTCALRAQLGLGPPPPAVIAAMCALVASYVAPAPPCGTPPSPLHRGGMGATASVAGGSGDARGGGAVAVRRSSGILGRRRSVAAAPHGGTRHSDGRSTDRRNSAHHRPDPNGAARTRDKVAHQKRSFLVTGSVAGVAARGAAAAGAADSAAAAAADDNDDSFAGIGDSQLDALYAETVSSLASRRGSLGLPLDDGGDAAAVVAESHLGPYVAADGTRAPPPARAVVPLSVPAHAPVPAPAPAAVPAPAVPPQAARIPPRVARPQAGTHPNTNPPPAHTTTVMYGALGAAGPATLAGEAAAPRHTAVHAAVPPPQLSMVPRLAVHGDGHDHGTAAPPPLAPRAEWEPRPSTSTPPTTAGQWDVFEPHAGVGGGGRSSVVHHAVPPPAAAGPAPAPHPTMAHAFIADAAAATGATAGPLAPTPPLPPAVAPPATVGVPRDSAADAAGASADVWAGGGGEAATAAKGCAVAHARGASQTADDGTAARAAAPRVGGKGFAHASDADASIDAVDVASFGRDAFVALRAAGGARAAGSSRGVRACVPPASDGDAHDASLGAGGASFDAVALASFATTTCTAAAVAAGVHTRGAKRGGDAGSAADAADAPDAGCSWDGSVGDVPSSLTAQSGTLGGASTGTSVGAVTTVTTATASTTATAAGPSSARAAMLGSVVTASGTAPGSTARTLCGVVGGVFGSSSPSSSAVAARVPPLGSSRSPTGTRPHSPPTPVSAHSPHSPHSPHSAHSVQSLGPHTPRGSHSPQSVHAGCPIANAGPRPPAPMGGVLSAIPTVASVIMPGPGGVMPPAGTACDTARSTTSPSPSPQPMAHSRSAHGASMHSTASAASSFVSRGGKAAVRAAAAPLAPMAKPARLAALPAVATPGADELGASPPGGGVGGTPPQDSVTRTPTHPSMLRGPAPPLSPLSPLSPVSAVSASPRPPSRVPPLAGPAPPPLSPLLRAPSHPQPLPPTHPLLHPVANLHSDSSGASPHHASHPHMRPTHGTAPSGAHAEAPLLSAASLLAAVASLSSAGAATPAPHGGHLPRVASTSAPAAAVALSHVTSHSTATGAYDVGASFDAPPADGGTVAGGSLPPSLQASSLPASLVAASQMAASYDAPQSPHAHACHSSSRSLVHPGTAASATPPLPTSAAVSASMSALVGAVSAASAPATVGHAPPTPTCLPAALFALSVTSVGSSVVHTPCHASASVVGGSARALHALRARPTTPMLSSDTGGSGSGGTAVPLSPLRSAVGPSYRATTAATGGGSAVGASAQRSGTPPRSSTPAPLDLSDSRTPLGCSPLVSPRGDTLRGGAVTSTVACDSGIDDGFAATLDLAAMRNAHGAVGGTSFDLALAVSRPHTAHASAAAQPAPMAPLTTPPSGAAGGAAPSAR